MVLTTTKFGDSVGRSLSPEQERHWFLNQFYSDDVIFNYFFMIDFKGSLCIETLTKSINEVLKRHEVLRAYFPINSGVPNLKIRPFSFINLLENDISLLPESDRELEFNKLALKECRYKFDVSNDLLFRANLIKLENENHVLVINTHRLIFDDTSKNIFINELSSLYKSIILEEPIELPKLDSQYNDFVRMQRDQKVMEDKLTYWTKKLEGDTPELDLPKDYVRKSISKFEGRKYTFEIPPLIKRKIDKLSYQENLNLSTILMTVLKVLLFRYTGVKDISVGIVESGRSYIESIPMIGLFENSLVMRTSLQEDMTARTALHEVKKVSEEAYKHREVSFAKIIERVNPKRNLYNSNPFFNVMINMSKQEQKEVDLQDIIIKEMNFDQDTAMVDLLLKVEETSDDELKCSFTYDKHLFKEDTIKRMVGHFNTILEGVLTDCDIQISQIPLLTSQEKNQLLFEWNKPTIDNPRNSTIYQLFVEQVQLHPENIALIFGDTKVSYRELNQRIDQIANYLMEQEIAEEQLIAIFLERSPDMIASFLAVLKTGCAYVPIDLSYPAERIQYMLEDSGVEYIIAKASTELPYKKAKALYIDKLPKKINSTLENFQRGKPENLAYVMYTSGSTGKPKGVAVEQRGIVRLVKDIIYADVGPQEIILNRAPVAFDASVFEIYGSLLNCGALVLIDSSKPTFKDIANTIKKNKVTTLRSTPGILNVLLDEYSEDLGSLKQIISSGEALSVLLAQKILSGLPECKLINAYGPTENTVSTTSYHVKEINKNSTTIPIGRPISNDCVYILDKHLQPVPIGVVGDLYLSGIGTARGYLNKPDITIEKFSNNPFISDNNIRMYKSGDLAKYRTDGNIEYVGRDDNQVKIRGFRIELGEVENLIGLMPGVRHAVASTTKIKDGSSDLVVYLIMKKGFIFNRQEIRAFAQEKMPQHLIPSFFVELKEFPVTPVGKVDRKRLPEPVIEISNENIIRPRNKTEEKLVKIWEELLGVKPIGVKDHYFELGGNSLLAMKMFSEIKKTFNKNLPVSLIFEEDTIEKLALLLSTDSENTKEQSIVPIHPNGTKPPLFCIHGGGGEVLIYKDLSVSLGLNQPLYGLRYKNDEINSDVSIEGLAEKYVYEIKKIQPFGPYHILGFCFGGAIAYEMAQRLISTGEEVGSLSILNFGNPNMQPIKVKKQSEATIQSVFKNNLIMLMKIPARQKAGFFLEKAKNAAKLIINGPETSLPQNSTRSILREAMRLYKPKPFPGNIMLIRADKSNDMSKLGWETSGKGRIAVHCIPAEHETLLKEPFVDLVAKYINEQLAKVIK